MYNYYDFLGFGLCIVFVPYRMTRDAAIEYLLENTAIPLGQIEAEIDRYITWPGQATSYKMGEIAIRQLRKTSEQRLGIY